MVRNMSKSMQGHLDVLRSGNVSRLENVQYYAHHFPEHSIALRMVSNLQLQDKH